MGDACLHRWLIGITTRRKKRKTKKRRSANFARNASPSVMHKLLTEKPRFSAREQANGPRGGGWGRRRRLAGRKARMSTTYTFLIVIFIGVDKGGPSSSVGPSKWASLNKLPCIILHACAPVIPYR